MLFMFLLKREGCKRLTIQQYLMASHQLLVCNCTPITRALTPHTGHGEFSQWSSRSPTWCDRLRWIPSTLRASMPPTRKKHTGKLRVIRMLTSQNTPHREIIELCDYQIDLYESQRALLCFPVNKFNRVEHWVHAYPSHCVRAGHGLARDRFDESWEDWKENCTRGEETKGVCASLNACGDGFFTSRLLPTSKIFQQVPEFHKGWK